MKKWFRKFQNIKAKNISNPNYSLNESKDKDDFLLDVDELKNSTPTFDTTEIIKVNWKDIQRMKKKRKKDANYHLQNNSGYVIEVKNIYKNYRVSRNKVAQILKGIDLKVKRGEFLILFGKSGSGKSTLLNIMSGLDRADYGDVVVENVNLPYLSNEELTRFRRQHIAFIFQQYHLLNNITGYENVETGLILQKHKDRKNFDIKKAFEEFDLLDVIDKYPSQMSGGQQQRISILRALAKNADIIFADEPTSALDKNTGITVMELLKKINIEKGTTIVMVSHDPGVIKYATRKVVLNKGIIISDEKVEQ